MLNFLKGKKVFMNVYLFNCLVPFSKSFPMRTIPANKMTFTDAGSRVFLANLVNIVPVNCQSAFINRSQVDISGIEQERRNSSALAMELRFSCTNPLTWYLNEKQRNNESRFYLSVWIDVQNAKMMFILFRTFQLIQKYFPILREQHFVKWSTALEIYTVRCWST